MNELPESSDDEVLQDKPEIDEEKLVKILIEIRGKGFDATQEGSPEEEMLRN